MNIYILIESKEVFEKYGLSVFTLTDFPDVACVHISDQEIYLLGSHKDLIEQIKVIKCDLGGWSRLKGLPYHSYSVIKEETPLNVVIEKLRTYRQRLTEHLLGVHSS